ncbi:hypothetical protein CMV_026088 [Castanea mollissima]|uniref:Uncharacterized protein n=1 Tax=Castanea mollissima TaxID=60419 RepID=A0A8J4QDV1_9ROSI|nr:hypothetical protein CMV_026088 [Castanea mollissima]
MMKSRTVSSNIPKLSLSLLTNSNLFLQEYSIPSIQAIDLNRSLSRLYLHQTHSVAPQFQMNKQPSSKNFSGISYSNINPTV